MKPASLGFVMEIDHRGEIVGWEMNEGVIRSAERMTYTDVNAVLENDAATKARYPALVPHFERMVIFTSVVDGWPTQS